MELSGRIFGFSQWSMLAPQALEGVASVALLYAAVKRWFGPGPGLVAGLVLALTPVAALMFRFNNPDALLVLLMTAAAYTLVRAIENGRTRWLVLHRPADRVRVPGQDAAGVPGRAGLRGRLPVGRAAPARPPDLADGADGRGHRGGAGWWVLVAELTPAADRPYFGGSTNNNILQLAIGYNGLGRLTGNETGSIGRRRGRRRAGRLVRRRDRDPAAVPLRVRRPDQLAAARRADLAGRDGLGVAAGGADRPDPGRGAAVGRLGAGHRAGVQLHERHHPPVLHGRAGARHRRAGRHRGDGSWRGSGGVAPEAHGRSGSGGPGAWRWRSASPSPRRGRSCCSTGRRTGCRGCAG